MVAKGYAVPIRHRHDDDNRSSAYDELRKAEDKAVKEQKGIRAKTLPDPMRVADVSGEVPKARAFLPFLKGTLIFLNLDTIFKYKNSNKLTKVINEIQFLHLIIN